MHFTKVTTKTLTDLYGVRQVHADPPSIPNTGPTVPTPEEVRLLIAEAERHKRPEIATAMLVAATTTGHRRAELWLDVLPGCGGWTLGEVVSAVEAAAELSIAALSAARAVVFVAEESAVGESSTELVDACLAFGSLFARPVTGSYLHGLPRHQVSEKPGRHHLRRSQSGSVDPRIPTTRRHHPGRYHDAVLGRNQWGGVVR
jgi:hypothetical protein